MIRKTLNGISEILKLDQNDLKMLSPLDNKILLKMDELSDIFQVRETDKKIVAYILRLRMNSTTGATITDDF